LSEPGDLKNWSAIILAAGGSSRFGAHKLLADLAGEPVVAQTVRAVCAAGFGETVVVTGAERDAVSAVLSAMPCRLVHAADWNAGISASIRAGVSVVPKKREGFFLFLGDMPLVPVSLCEELALLAASSGYAARPLCSDMPGHPVAFVAMAVADLMKLKGDEGAGSLLRNTGSKLAYLPTTDEGAILDVDTPADLAAVKRAWKSRFTSDTIDSAISRGDLPNP
jgi:molybdenum cofactor cytidylyltransferase